METTPPTGELTKPTQPVATTPPATEPTEPVQTEATEGDQPTASSDICGKWRMKVENGKALFPTVEGAEALTFNYVWTFFDDGTLEIYFSDIQLGDVAAELEESLDALATDLQSTESSMRYEITGENQLAFISGETTFNGTFELTDHTLLLTMVDISPTAIEFVRIAN